MGLKMRATKSILVLIFTVLCALSSPAASQSIGEALEKLESSRDSSCRASSSSISQLIASIETSAKSGNGIAEIAKGLNAVALEHFWVSDNQLESLRALTNISVTLPNLGPLIAEAQSSARGELKSLVFRNLDDPLNMLKVLEELAQTNKNLGKSNPYYVAEINLTLAEFLSDYAFSEISQEGWPLPLNEKSNSEIKSLVLKAAELYGRLADFYSEEHAKGGILSRDVGLDFLFQAALLKYVAGNLSWKTDLVDLASNFQDRDIYASFRPVPHIFVYGFLLPPRFVEQSNSVDDTSVPGCKRNSSREVGVNNVLIGKLIKRFYNPTQLVVHACSVLNTENGFPSLLALSSALARFKSQDYRVVLGHFEGEEIRFSRFSKSELMEVAASELAKLPEPEISAGYLEADKDCLSDVNLDLIAPPSFSLSDQLVGPQEGYIYFGEQLNYSDAKKLLNQLKGVKHLKDAYLLRPKI